MINFLVSTNSNLMIGRQLLVWQLLGLLQVLELVLQSQSVCIQRIERALQIRQTRINFVNLLQVWLKCSIYDHRRAEQEILHRQSFVQLQATDRKVP